MTEYFDAEALLADVRRMQKRADEVARRARTKLGVRTPRSHPTDGLTAEEIERDTASIYKIMDVWRRIGKTTPSPITLPSGRTIVPKKSATNERGRTEYAVTRPRRHRGVSA
jgi:hypothetical protein